jgi:GTP cyclohydrolase FolE2
MQDVQNQTDARGIAIQRVGIKDAHLPFLIKTKDGGFPAGAGPHPLYGVAADGV